MNIKNGFNTFMSAAYGSEWKTLLDEHFQDQLMLAFLGGCSLAVDSAANQTLKDSQSCNAATGVLMKKIFPS